MEYRPFSGLSLSRLGMGNMRLPIVPGQGEKIDEGKAGELIEAAYEAGINYFDTAYRYHAGESEVVTGKALSALPRDRFYLATKFPGHMMSYHDGAYRFTGMLAAFPARSPPVPRRNFFRNNLKNAGWITLIFIFCIMYVRSPGTFTPTKKLASWIIFWSRKKRAA